MEQVDHPSTHMATSPPVRWHLLDTVVDEALARPRDERTAYLRAQCGHDAELYAEACALLERLVEAGQALGD